MTHPKSDGVFERPTLFVDVDDTLLLHDLSEYPNKPRINISCNGRDFVGIPHEKNINMLIKFYKLGYEITVWSKTGKEWAREVSFMLNVNRYVTTYLKKPDFIMDDKAPSEWIGPNVYRSPK